MPRPITRRAVDGKCPTCHGTDLNARSYCRPCLRIYDRAHRAKDPEKRRARDAARSRAWRGANPEKARAQDLRAHYRLSQEQFDELVRSQENACAICRRPDPNCVDHCHETRRVRGVLCRSCNTGMGQFRDDPSLLLAAADYIEEHANEGA